MSARELGLPAVGLPGVHKWEEGWPERFAGRDVVVMFDSDPERREAAQRVASLLTPHAASVKVLDLDPGREDGYDLSDLLLEAGEDRTGTRRMLLNKALEAPSLVPRFLRGRRGAARRPRRLRSAGSW